MCYMCKKIGELMDILLLHCDVASALCSTLFSRFGMFWVIPRKVIDLFACWWCSRRPMSVALWKMMPICLFWCLWREKNNRSFEDLERTLEEILSSFYHTLYLWTTTYVYPCHLVLMTFLLAFLFLIKLNTALVFCHT
jgi:hypothetical protein